MSEVIKAEEGKSSSDDLVDFSIDEKDVKNSLKTFVKGMNESEKRRFLAIYAKYQDKGGNNTAEGIKHQKQIQF